MKSIHTRFILYGILALTEYTRKPNNVDGYSLWSALLPQQRGHLQCFKPTWCRSQMGLSISLLHLLPPMAASLFWDCFFGSISRVTRSGVPIISSQVCRILVSLLPITLIKIGLHSFWMLEMAAHSFLDHKLELSHEGWRLPLHASPPKTSLFASHFLSFMPHFPARCSSTPPIREHSIQS